MDKITHRLDDLLKRRNSRSRNIHLYIHKNYINTDFKQPRQGRQFARCQLTVSRITLNHLNQQQSNKEQLMFRNNSYGVQLGSVCHFTSLSESQFGFSALVSQFSTTIAEYWFIPKKS